MRVGFVGCGRHATTTLYPALHPAGLQLVATCAVHLEKASETARTFGAARAYDDVDVMLSYGELDAVIVSVPPHAYRDIVLRCVNASLSVFCEKPGAESPSTLAAIEAAARGAGVRVMIGYMKRFAPAYKEALRRARLAEFGRVTSVHVKFVVGAGLGSMRSYVIDNAVHAFDLLRLFGGEVAAAQAEALSLDDQRHALGVLVRFESGAVGTAQLGSTASFHQENESLEVVGDGCSVAVTNVDTLVARPAHGPVEVHRPTYTVPLAHNFTGTTMGFVPELEHFRQVVQEGMPCESDITSARRTLELADLVLERTGA